ncbi:MAG: TaqI-like C-terminal specificity domain-containing protein, partial [Phycisphaerae bacterium]
ADNSCARVSFVSASYLGTKQKFSNYRRYTYFISPETQNRTFQNQLEKCKFEGVPEILKAFSIEAVNKEFYEKIASLYFNLLDSDKNLLGHPCTDDTVRKNFAVRLLGRLLFCWFLRKKKSGNGVPLISGSILSKDAIQTNYYHSTLEPLFFKALNTEKKSREDDCKQGDFGLVPFLNGGLFTPHADDHYDAAISRYGSQVNIGDDWFKRLFDVFEQYNFTIDESTSSDVEISIDPEMLGRIFENLLASINPETEQTARNETGSFYTPREIVDYMVDESLKNHLYSTTSIEHEKIDALFIAEAASHNLSELEIDAVIDSLHGLKTLDPACGSGAFPMGILQRMLFVLERIDPGSKKWLEKSFSALSDSLLREKAKRNRNTAYVHKLGIIRNSIHGVDLQQIAVEISRLRVFLSLVVDESVEDDKPNRGVDTLPNLEFKFVCANTLIKLPERAEEESKSMFVDPFEEISDKIKKLVEEYFSDAGNDKEIAKQKINACIAGANKKLREENWYSKNAERYIRLCSWKPFDDDSCPWFDPEWMFGVKDGFDIVIGNPPYVQIQSMGEEEKRRLAAQGYYSFGKTADLYCLFYERAFDLLSRSGRLCYITSNKWMRAAYGKKLRELLSGAVDKEDKEDKKHKEDKEDKYACPELLIDFGGYKVFETATVDTNILLAQARQAASGSCPVACRVDKGFTKATDIAEYISDKSMPIRDLSGESWLISTPEEMKIREKIQKAGTPLKDWDIKIYRGILTGCNDAFIIDGVKKDELIAKDPKSAEIIKPILRGKDIKRYKANFADKWLICTLPAYHLDIEKYPAVKEHLNSFMPKLKQTGEEYIDESGNKQKTRKRTNNKWFEVQDTISYYKEFEKEKIIYPNMTKYLPFILDEKGFLTNQKCFIMTGEAIKYLAAYLNSNLFKFAFRDWFPELLGGTRELSKVFFENLPIPKLSEQEQAPFISLAERILAGKEAGEDTAALEAEVDRLVYDLYGLTEEEIKIVEGGA